VFYEEFDAAPDLAAHVAQYWTMRVAPDVSPGFPHRIFPDGCIALAVRASPSGGVALVGPRAAAFTVPVFPGDRYWGVRFWPDAGGLVLGVPARPLAGVVGDATAVLGRPAATALADALRSCRASPEAGAVFDAALRPRVDAAPALDPVVRAAVVGLVASRGEVSVAELAREVGVSARQLQRRFGAAVGLGPKQFARVRRLRTAIGELLTTEPRTWSAVAADLGYADQAHLVREFVQLAGLTPAAVTGAVRAITHGRVTP
jgi:AraC-like DNA-binding protein